VRYWEIAGSGAKVAQPKLLVPSLRGPYDIKLPGRSIGHAERGASKKAGDPKSSR
jgi:hypothetical protein